MNMSVIENLIKCTKCDFVSSDTNRYGSFKYLDDKAIYYLDKDDGWCYDCNSIVAIESLTELKSTIDSMISIAEKISIVKNANMLTKLTSNYKEIKRNYDYYIKELDILKWSIKFITNRKSLPRCLTCGSTEVSKLNIPSTSRGDEAGKKIRIGYKHPNCGGELYLETGTVSTFYQYNDIYYNTEGQRIINKER